MATTVNRPLQQFPHLLLAFSQRDVNLWTYLSSKRHLHTPTSHKHTDTQHQPSSLTHHWLCVPQCLQIWTGEIESSIDRLFHGPVIRQAAQATSVPVSGIRYGRTWYVPVEWTKPYHSRLTQNWQTITENSQQRWHAEL